MKGMEWKIFMEKSFGSTTTIWWSKLRTWKETALLQNEEKDVPKICLSARVSKFTQATLFRRLLDFATGRLGPRDRHELLASMLRTIRTTDRSLMLFIFRRQKIVSLEIYCAIQPNTKHDPASLRPQLELKGVWMKHLHLRGKLRGLRPLVDTLQPLTRTSGSDSDPEWFNMATLTSSRSRSHGHGVFILATPSFGRRFFRRVDWF